MRRRLALPVVASAIAASSLAACSTSSSKHTTVPVVPTFAPAAAAQVPLTVAGQLKHPVRIGLVVSTSSQRGEGGDDLELASGALVAGYRLNLAAADKVTLDVADDHGNGDGSDAAVKKLLSDGDIGIVYASEGGHLRRGLADAAAASVPVLLPYASSAPGVGIGDYFTGPTAAQDVAQVTNILQAGKLTDTLVLTSGPQLPQVSTLATTNHVISLQAGPTLDAQILAVAKKTSADTHIDSIVVFAPSATQAETVAALQQQDVRLPVVLGGEALSPTFASRLNALELAGMASTVGTYASVGVAASDVNNATGEQAFLAGLRLAAGDANLTALETSLPFSAQGAAAADTRSHDAVLALVVAAAKAGAATAGATTAGAITAADEAAALNGLSVTAADGLAGPALNFSAPASLAASSVVQLQASTTDPGARTGIAEAQTTEHWFVVPNAAG